MKAPGIPAPLPPASVEKSKTKNKTKEPDDEQDSQILAEYRLGLSVSMKYWYLIDMCIDSKAIKIKNPRFFYQIDFVVLFCLLK